MSWSLGCGEDIPYRYKYVAPAQGYIHILINISPYAHVVGILGGGCARRRNARPLPLQLRDAESKAMRTYHTKATAVQEALAKRVAAKQFATEETGRIHPLHP